MEAVPDTFRKGLYRTEQVAAVHPVHVIQATSEKQKELLRNFTLANVYGSHMPLRLQMEQTILSQIQRLPGLHSSFAGLETLLGKDEEIGFEDIFNDPEYSVENIDVHEAMEQRLKLGVPNLHFR